VEKIGGSAMEPVLDWEARYQESSVPWERTGLNPAFVAWQSWLRDHQGGTVVVPGCGRSPELQVFADMGFNVIGVDLSPSAAQFQETALAAKGLDGKLVVSNLFDWSPDTPVDFVYEQTCLCALKPDHWRAYENLLTGWLRPGGTLLALFMQTGESGGPPFHCEKAAMEQLFSEERWIWGETSVRSEHPLGVHELGFRLTLR
jgi:hypothetical protein